MACSVICDIDFKCRGCIVIVAGVGAAVVVAAGLSPIDFWLVRHICSVKFVR